MTILFYTRFHAVVQKGGTEHTTIKIAKGLKQRYGVRCIGSYSIPFPGTQDGFEENVLIDFKQKKEDVVKQIVGIINQYEVDCVVLQGYFRETAYFREALNQCVDCRLVFAHHFAPGWERTQEMEVLHKIQMNKGLKSFRYKLKHKFFPLFQRIDIIKLKRRYNKAYRAADKVVVLSPSYIDEFACWAGVSTHHKIGVIPNALPFETMYDVSTIDKKEKIVLMVTRLDERQKRIRLALQLWKEAKQYPEAHDWRLLIIGDGEKPCTDEYKAWANTNSIPDVEFLGRCNPIGYYAKASIFLMTSLCEGLPLTILEARQQAVVPIAFNTFKAVDDILTDGQNGFILAENDRKGYIDRLLTLMKNKALREKMGVNATEGLEAFTTDTIMKRWMDLLTSL